MTAKFTVTVKQVLDDGSEAPLEGELAAALAAPAEQFAGLAAWAAGEARFCDHGEREKVIGEEGRELQRLVLQASFDVDAAREERPAEPVISAAGIRHGIVEAGHGRGVTSVFGPVRVTRMACRNRREPNLYPADARQVLCDDPYSLGMRALAAFHLAGGGFGQAQEVIEARTGVKIGRAQLTGLAGDLAAWTDDFYAGRARDADTDLPASDVLMMQGDGKGIAMRPEHRRNAGKEDGTRPGVKKMAGIVAVADFTPAVREPGDIAAPPARRRAHPGPKARDKWVSASVTESIEDMIAAAYDEADRRDPQRVRQRVFLVDGNKQQLSAIEAKANERGLKVPVLIDYIHVSGYIGKAAAALHPGDPVAAGQWADGRLLRVLHGRAKAVAAILASVARKTRENPRKRGLDLTDMDRAVTYLTNNQQHMKYDKALEKGWPIATGMIEGASGRTLQAGHAIDLDRAVDLAGALAGALAGDLGLARGLSLTRDLADARDLARGRARDRAADLARSLHQAVGWAEELVGRSHEGEVDASGADLSALDLTDISVLAGVVWTEETAWPPGIAGQVRARSREIRPRVYRVCGGSQRDPSELVRP